MAIGELTPPHPTAPQEVLIEFPDNRLMVDLCGEHSRNLAIIEEQDLMGNAARLEPLFQGGLRKLADHPLVGEVRGAGLMACVECVADRESRNPLALDNDVGKRIDRHCHELGLLVRPLINMCVMSPPLTITREQVDHMVAILHEGISRTMDELRAEGVWQG